MPRKLGLSAGKRSQAALASEAWERLERVLAHFQDAWRRGQRPDLDAYLAAAQAERHALLVELAHEDLELRLKAGEPARAEDYLARYPELHGEREVVLGLITAEYALRRPREPGCSPEEYGRRFPAFREELAVRLSHSPVPSPTAALPASDAAEAVTQAFLRETEALLQGPGKPSKAK